MSSIFDVFTNNVAQAAAADQIQGLNTGYGLANNAINTGSQDLTNYFGQALAPYTTNYSQAQQGTTSLADALGLNGGPAGAKAAATAYASNPAYNFQLQQGSQNVLRNAAQTGTTASGATLNALQQQGQGLANQTYQQYIQNLNPYLGQSSTAAAGIAGVNTGLGTSLNQNQNSLASLGWQYGTGTGNAQANAQLAQNGANNNIWSAISGGVSGAAQAAPSIISGLTSLFSDERLKEDIKEVGELRDGQPVYSYRYIWDDPAMTRIGLMAQDVEKINPDAVTEVGGFKAVDYGKATDLAAYLAKFGDDAKSDNVVAFPQKRVDNKTDLARYLEAA